MLNLDDLSREDLIKLIDIYAKNWLAHDGSWFLALEERYGLETAIEMDARSWERFSPIEAKRIMQAFGIPEHGGLEALEKALSLRLYASLNEQAMQCTEDGALEFRMVECRVQSTRRRKGLADFPCKSVGIIEYTRFAQAVDPRLQTECVACPPDQADGAYCIWRFRLKEE